jgi:hypothetical protein
MLTVTDGSSRTNTPPRNEQDGWKNGLVITVSIQEGPVQKKMKMKNGWMDGEIHDVLP